MLGRVQIPIPRLSRLSAVCRSASVARYGSVRGVKMGQTARHSMPVQIPAPQAKGAQPPVIRGGRLFLSLLQYNRGEYPMRFIGRC